MLIITLSVFLIMKHSTTIMENYSEQAALNESLKTARSWSTQDGDRDKIKILIKFQKTILMFYYSHQVNISNLDDFKFICAFEIAWLL